MPLQFQYHEHAGNECTATSHDTSCPPNAISFDCQATSSGVCSCTHVLDTDTASTTSLQNDQLAWDLNSQLLSFRQRTSTPSRHSRPV